MQKNSDQMVDVSACLELMNEYRGVPGVAGVHVMAPLNESAVPELVAEFRRRNRD